MATLCGDTVPAPIISSGNKLFMRFQSDDSEQRRGYKIKVSIGKNLITSSILNINTINRKNNLKLVSYEKYVFSYS